LVFISSGMVLTILKPKWFWKKTVLYPY